MKGESIGNRVTIQSAILSCLEKAKENFPSMAAFGGISLQIKKEKRLVSLEGGKGVGEGRDGSIEDGGSRRRA